MTDLDGQQREALAKGCREWEDRHTEAIPATREFAEFLGEWMWRAALAVREEPGDVDDREWTLTQDFEHPCFGVADGPSLGVDERITVVPKSHVPAREDTERPRAARTSDDDLADLQACAQEVRDAFAGEDTGRQGEEVDALPNQDNQGLREAANGVLDHYYHRRAKSLLQDRTLQAAMQRLHRAVAAREDTERPDEPSGLDKLAAERGRSMGQVIEDAKRIEREFGQEKRVVVCERCGHAQEQPVVRDTEQEPEQRVGHNKTPGNREHGRLTEGDSQ